MFSEFWAQYPRKVAKKSAEKAYRRVTKRVMPERIVQTLSDRMKGEWRAREPQYLPYPATFLNGEDFSEECQELLLIAEEPLQGHRHWCEQCDVTHSWDCFDEPICFKSAKAPCPTAKA